MKVTDFLEPELVVPELQARDKRGVLGELVGALARRRPDLDPERLLAVLLEREKLGSTGIGDGVAIPHAKLAGFPALLGVFGRSAEGVDFQAIDGRPSHLFFVLFAPEQSAGIHLKALARISRLFKNPDFRRAILEAGDAAAVWRRIADEDAKY